MIDVNKITSTLAKLPDAQLQQYAQMHKADPYIMSLAMSESNRRKEVRAASQAPARQEQPKVVDQGIAAMAPQPAPQQRAQAMPEDQGIGQLNAGNMNFAGGGIIAFADGGDVERYRYGGMPKPTSMMGDIPGFVAGTGNFIPQPGQPEEEPYLRKLYRQMAEQAEVSRAAEARRRVAEGRAAPSDAIAPLANPAQDMAQFDAASNLYMTERAGKQATDATAAAAAVAAAKTGAERPPAPRREPAAPSLAAPSYAGLDPAAMMRKEMELAGKQPHPQAKELEEIGKAKVTAKEAEVTGLEAIQQKYNDIFKGRKERLDTKEGEIAKMGDQSLGLALLQAGAAMMSTPGGIGAAVGKGIDVGSKQYVAGLDKLNAAKDKLSDARDRMEEIDAQRGEMSARELFKARNEVKNTQIGAKEDMVKALMQRDNINRETALKMVDNQIKLGISQLEQQSQTAQTGARIASAERIAAMPSAQVQMITTLGGGNFNKGYEIYKQEASVPRLYESYTKMASDPLKGADFQAKYPTFETYMAGSGMLGGGKSGILDIPDTAAPAGPVRPRG